MLINDFQSKIQIYKFIYINTDFHRRLKLYRILSASIISLDCFSNIVIHSVDYFTLASNEDKSQTWRVLYYICEVKVA
jgi:hypothetical protein